MSLPLFNSRSRLLIARIVPLLFLFLVALPATSVAQYSIWSVRVGPSLGFQKWNGVGSTQPLLGYHGAVAVESYEPGNPFAFFAELGYHLRGSSKRIQGGQTNGGLNYDPYTIRNSFHNIGLAFGGRKHFGEFNQFYYMLALRGEITAAFELQNYYQGLNQDVRRFNYGLDVGGGINIPLGYHMGFLQIQLQPDLSRQIYSLPISGYDYFGNPYVFPEQRVINYSFELSVGIRFNGNVEIEE